MSKQNQDGLDQGRSPQKYQVDVNKLTLNSGVQIVFLYPIKKIVSFDVVLVILLDYQKTPVSTERIYALDSNGNTIWQGFDVLPAGRKPLVTNIWEEDDQLGVFDGWGMQYMLEPETGIIISREFVK